MLIDTYAEDWLGQLNERSIVSDTPSQVLLLVDGAFIPGVHSSIPPCQKALLFAKRPACSAVVEDVSPFLMHYVRDDAAVLALLQRCSRWPMLSAIQTSLPLNELADQLAAWCVIEADGQAFNFRFADTRRLPAIYAALTSAQRASFSGSAQRWSYIARDGCWQDLPLERATDRRDIAPSLTEAQFARLVDDSQVDEICVWLRNRGHAVFSHPSKNHARLALAVQVAHANALPDDELTLWCEWLWQQSDMHELAAISALLQQWREEERG